jgi:acetolactate synthase regulatory subunit
MASQTDKKRVSLQMGEIAKYYNHSPEGDIQDEEFFYVVDKVMHGDKIEGYLLLPVHIFKKDSPDENHKQELDLLQKKRGFISERFTGNNSTTYYRAECMIVMHGTDYKEFSIPVDLIADVRRHKILLEKSIEQFVDSNHVHITQGQSTSMFSVLNGVASQRKQAPEHGVGNYLDIDLMAAAKAELIPQEVADILRTHGKIQRLSTALRISSDPDKGKLYQIFAKESPTPSISYNDFRHSIRQGMSRLSQEIANNPEEFQARLDEDTILRYSGKEKITFRFKPNIQMPDTSAAQDMTEKIPDISIDDAKNEGYFIHPDTHYILQTAGVKTLREAWGLASIKSSNILKMAFGKALITFIPLKTIKADIIEAFHAFEDNISNPDEYGGFKEGTKIIYKDRELT